MPGLLTFPNIAQNEERVIEKPIQEAVDDIEVKDGLHAAEYAQEICSYLRALEKKDLHSPEFLEKNSEIKPRMRGILVDWLIQVQYHLGLHQETLYFAVRVLDRVLERRHVAVTQLQLLGVAALWIGTKIEEYEPGDVEELLRLTMDSYTVQQMLVMERSILKCLNFELAVAEPMVFLNKFIHVAGEEWNKKVLNVATYSVDILLPDIKFVAFPSSYLAAAALYVGILVQSCSATQWTRTLEHHTGYTEDEVLPVVIEMLTALKLTAEGKSELDGTFMKYCSRSKYEGVAQSPELAPERLHLLLQFVMLLAGMDQ